MTTERSRKKPSAAAQPVRAKVFLVDDHPLLREGLAQRLSLEEDLTVCGQAGDGVQAVEAIRNQLPDLMIVDISLSGRDGIDLVKELKARFPKLPVLVFSMHDESLYAERALHAGARGYVMKNAPPEYLIRAIRRILAGEVVVGEGLVARMLHRMTDSAAAEAAPVLKLLTDRELEIFRRIGEGHPRNRIAADLHLSVKTVEAHRANIRQKLGLRNAAELMQHAIRFVLREGASAPD